MTRHVASPIVGGLDRHYVPHLRAAEDRHFWFRARNDVIRAVLAQVEPTLPPGYRVLEVGCGTGNTLRVVDAACRRGTVIGLDLQRDALVYARDRVGSVVVQGDIAHAPFRASARFDLIVMFDVLEHIENDRAALATVHEWLAPDGVLLLTVPAGPELWSAFDTAAQHYRRYNPGHLSSKLSEAGFSVTYLSPFMMTLYPLMWAKRRLLSGAYRQGDAVLDDLRIVPGINALLGWLLSREVAHVAHRRTFPFGASLIALGRRGR